MHDILASRQTPHQSTVQPPKYLSPQPVSQTREVYVEKMMKSKSPPVISRRTDIEPR